MLAGLPPKEDKVRFVYLFIMILACLGGYRVVAQGTKVRFVLLFALICACPVVPGLSTEQHSVAFVVQFAKNREALKNMFEKRLVSDSLHRIPTGDFPLIFAAI